MSAFGQFVYQGHSFGPPNEECTTTSIGGKPVLIVNAGSNLEAVVEANANRTILIRAGTYTVTGNPLPGGGCESPFQISTGAIVKPYNCETVNVIMNSCGSGQQGNNSWTLAGIHFDCSGILNNAVCISLDGADNTIVRNNWIDNADRAYNVADAAVNTLVEGNIIEGPPGNVGISDLIKFGGNRTSPATLTNAVFQRNWVRLDPTNTARGNDTMNISFNFGEGPKILNNLWTGANAIEQYMDIKQNTATTAWAEVAYNTFVGPHMGWGGDVGTTFAVVVGDDDIGVAPECYTTWTCPSHKFHHNYFYHSYSAIAAPNGRRAAIGLRLSGGRVSQGTYEFNVDHNAQNSTAYNMEFTTGKWVIRHNAFYMGNWFVEPSSTTAAGTCSASHAGAAVAMAMENNAFHLTRITDLCTGSPDWSVTNNVFSQVQGGGIDAGHQGAGNSTDTIAYASTTQAAPDFTILGGTHSQKGVLPAPVINNAVIGNDCVLRISMSPYNVLYNHGPMSTVDLARMSVTYGGGNAFRQSASIIGNSINVQMAACPSAGQTVVFSATHGWCQDSAGIGGDVTDMNAKCLAVTNQSVTNNAAGGGGGGGQDTFYVDADCGVNGNGTTQTCGASGPWSSLRNALEVAQCSGMVDGDILALKGALVKDLHCDSAEDDCFLEGGIAIPASCSGIIIQNASATDHVVVSGRAGIGGITWTSRGGGVYECTNGPGLCGFAVGVETPPFHIWYNRGAGKSTLILKQTDRDCDAPSLPAGYFSFDPVDSSICVHLDDGSSPATAAVWYAFQPDLIDGILSTATNVTFRKNPLGGSFSFTGYRQSPFDLQITRQTGWTFDSLNMEWNGLAGIRILDGPGVASIKVMDSVIDYSGPYGIQIQGDTGSFEVNDNIITNIGTTAAFELCSGIGVGCFADFNLPAVGIDIRSRNGVGGDVVRNTITNYGGALTGNATGIKGTRWNQNNVIDANYIAHASGLPGTGYGIELNCSLADNQSYENWIANNRIYNVDVGYQQEFVAGCTTQAGLSNRFYHNTLLNILEVGIRAAGAGVQDGWTIVRNNAFVNYTGAPLMIQTRASDTGWSIIQNNAFECDSCPVNHDIISYKDGLRTVELDGQCTPGTDCLVNFNGFEAGLTDNVQGNTAVTAVGTNPTMLVSDTSLLFNAGIPLGTADHDFEGDLRPLFGSWDIGADEVDTSVAPPPDATITQDNYRFYNGFGDEGDDPLAAINTAVRISKKAKFMLRLGIIVTAGSTPSLDTNLYARKNGGTWTQVDLSSSATVGVYILDHPERTNRSATTKLFTSGFTFVAGLFIDADADPIVSQLNINQQTEHEFQLGISSGAAIGDVIELRMQESSGSTFDVYTQTASLAVTKPGSEFAGRRQ
jgi:hypothetical protein